MAIRLAYLKFYLCRLFLIEIFSNALLQPKQYHWNWRPSGNSFHNSKCSKKTYDKAKLHCWEKGVLLSKATKEGEYGPN